MWKLTEFGEKRFGMSSLKVFLSDKGRRFIPEGCSFVVEGMGLGHFYMEEHVGHGGCIFYNEKHEMSLFDLPVAEWDE